MAYGYMESPEAYLMHHGIRGQKWGTRNGPPYPLDAGDHSAREKKLNNGKYTQGVHQDRDGSSEEETQRRRAEMADKAKKVAKGVAIGAGVAAGATAVTGALAVTAGLTIGGTAGVAGITKMMSNPEAMNQAVNNIGNALIGSIKSAKERRAIMGNSEMSAENKRSALNLLKNTNKADRAERKELLNLAKQRDAQNLIDRANKREDQRIDQKIKPLMDKLDDNNFVQKMVKDPAKYGYNSDMIEAIQRKGGTDEVRKIDVAILQNKKARENAKRYAEERRRTHGIIGAYNKVGKAYDTVTGFGNDNLNRFNRGRNLYYGVAAAGAGVAAASAKKKKEKERKRQQELQQYYYQ